MAEWRELASGLLFPEGPVAMRDGSVALVEIARGTVTRIAPNGQQGIIAMEWPMPGQPLAFEV